MMIEPPPNIDMHAIANPIYDDIDAKINDIIKNTIGSTTLLTVFFKYSLFDLSVSALYSANSSGDTNIFSGYDL